MECEQRIMTSVVVIRGGNPENYVGLMDVKVYDYVAPQEQTVVLIARRPRTDHIFHELKEVRVEYFDVPPGWLGSIVGNLRAFRQTAKYKPNTVVANPGYSIAALLLRLTKGCRVIVDVRSIPVGSGRLARILSTLLFYMPISLPMWNGATFITEGTKSHVNELAPFLGHLRTAVWESGVDEQEIGRNQTESIVTRDSLGIGKGVKVLIYQGTLSDSRGLSETITAFSMLPEEQKHRTLLIFVGTGPAETNLERQAIELGLTESVRFLGMKQHDDVMKILRASDIGVSPLPDYPWWRMSSPLKVYEYCAAGLLLVVTNIPSHHCFKDMAFFAESSNPRHLANAMSEALSLPLSTEEQLRKNAISFAAKSTWRSRAVTLSNLLRDVC